MVARARDDMKADDSFFRAKHIQLGGLSLNVNSGGEGPPILFLHGFPEQGKAWLRVAEELCKDHLCILPDQRGYNLSDKPDRIEDYAIDPLLGDIDALADAFDIDQFVLAGHDWGGALAWWYAARNPDRVSRLIIANAPHPALFQTALVEDKAQRLASQYITRLRVAGSENILLEGGAAAMWDRMFAANPAFDEAAKAIFTTAWSQPGALAGYARGR